MKEVKSGMDGKDFFDGGKGDEMISSQKDWKFLFREDPSQSGPNQAEASLFFSKRELQVSHIVDWDIRQVFLKIRAEGFDPPGGLSNG
jgi:hypothetical protein